MELICSIARLKSILKKSMKSFNRIKLVYRIIIKIFSLLEINPFLIGLGTLERKQTKNIY